MINLIKNFLSNPRMVVVAVILIMSMWLGLLHIVIQVILALFVIVYLVILPSSYILRCLDEGKWLTLLELCELEDGRSLIFPLWKPLVQSPLIWIKEFFEKGDGDV